MITGINTDVDFQGITYHVQTEDKGLATPLILSLVYNRGTILASKRSPYEDLLEKGFDEKVLAERLQKQHKTICAAIRAGRLEELKEMTAKDSAVRRKNAGENQTAKKQRISSPAINQTPVNAKQEINGNSAPKIETIILPVSETKSVQTEKAQVPNTSNPTSKISVYKGSESSLPKPKYNLTPEFVPVAAQIVPPNVKTEVDNFDADMMDDQLIIEAVEIIEDEMILPADAIKLIDDTKNNKPVDNKLKLEILGDESFKSGEKKTMSILVHRGGQENGMNGAQVMVKVLGAAFRPLIFHGKTDANGIAKVHLQMPLFKQGRAAILIKAMSEGEEIELRRTIKHK
ncbi:MAG: hypothetical protein ACR2F2_11885 [Pyrinomonadaceae bacterium]